MATYIYERGKNYKKESKIKVGRFSRTSTTEYDPKNYANTPMTGTVYGKGKGKGLIKKSKTVVTTTPFSTRTKTTKFGPVNYYGKQTKTTTKTKAKR